MSAQVGLNDYWSAYLLALQDPATATTRIKQPGAYSTNYLNGLLDGVNRTPPRDPEGYVPTASQLGGIPIPGRPAPVYTPKPGTTGGAFVPPPTGRLRPGGTSLVPGNVPVYEVYASVPLLGGVPFDTAEGYANNTGGGWVQTLERNLVKFTVLGGDPADSRDGFRLSGPRGPLAQRIAQAVSAGQLAPYPNAYGLSAWYGARTTRGIRILSQQQLQAIGLL